MAEAVEMRRGWWKYALIAVIVIEVLGGLSGWISNSGYGNDWFDGLQKPFFMPPGAAFGRKRTRMPSVRSFAASAAASSTSRNRKLPPLG